MVSAWVHQSDISVGGEPCSVAVFDATGVRLRHAPLTPEQLKPLPA
jgi:hypothetical protein